MNVNHRTTRRAALAVAFFFVTVAQAACSCAQTTADSPRLLAFRGPTMGTTYSVKVSDPPGSNAWAEEASLAIEAELRLVNDQMSTYLKSSELTRFNESTSTDWFDVSEQTALVVAYALEVGKKSGGAFDVTVGPLVDRWSFGPGRRNRDVPTDAELAEIGKRIGQKNLSVRRQPPALKKEIANLRVDLSAIAKGHGVDRVVEVLQRLGASNVFVEVGGEVRVTGMKQTPAGSVPWKVGIQKPDAASNDLALAYPMEESAMATSGDYRNFFEVDGVRYSHTIDPVLGRPVRHDLASVTVIADTCMAADAWATALNVVGPERAVELANENNLDTLLITRQLEPAGSESPLTPAVKGNSMTVLGTGKLAGIAQRLNAEELAAQASGAAEPGFVEQMTPIVVLTAIGFGAVLIAMAVGVIFGRKSISGSCGGLNARTDPDGVSRCSMCSSPSDGCKELREKIDSAHG